jgi:predicted dehydrogenase
MSTNSVEQIGVGLIGASPDSGWATYAHIPALAALPNFRLQAVSTTRQASADAAAQVFGAKHAFDNFEGLVACPDVDLVVVTVKVPHHRELAAAAIAAGKDVYCEWPLCQNEREAVALVSQAADAGVRTVIGLQSRAEPAIQTIRQLVTSKSLGEILSTTMIGTVNPGATIDRRNAYLADRANGANALTISGGHTIDAFCYCLGEFEELNALLDTRVKELTIVGSDEKIRKTSPDQIVVMGRLAGGAIANVHLRESLRGRSEFLWEINGTEGSLRVTAPHAHPGFYPLTVYRSNADGSEEVILDIDQALGSPPEHAEAIVTLGKENGPAANVARMYAWYADDRMKGVRTVPDFEDAAARHHLISLIESSSVSGTCVR